MLKGRDKTTRYYKAQKGRKRVFSMAKSTINAKTPKAELIAMLRKAMSSKKLAEDENLKSRVDYTMKSLDKDAYRRQNSDKRRSPGSSSDGHCELGCRQIFGGSRMTVGEIAAICGIPSALTVGIVGFLFWLLERRIAKKEAERVARTPYMNSGIQSCARPSNTTGIPRPPSVCTARGIGCTRSC